MAARFVIGQGMSLLGLAGTSAAGSALSGQAARSISVSAMRLWPDVLMPSMGESMKEGSIAAVLKQVGQPVREDEVIAQVETDKVTIDVKSPAAGVLTQILVKPSDIVVPGQLVAVVGEGAPVAAAAAPAPPAPAAPAAPAHSTSSGRAPMIKFPPRMTASGERISDLPAQAAAAPAAPAAAPEAPAVTSWPMPAAKAAPPPQHKNRLPYVTRPDGRGGPPRRPLTARELEMINLGGAN